MSRDALDALVRNERVAEDVAELRRIRHKARRHARWWSRGREAPEATRALWLRANEIEEMLMQHEREEGR